MNERLHKIGTNLIPAVAYGDAAGLAVETKSWRYIEQKYGTIDKLVSPQDNIYFEGVWPTGTTSDDTRLTVAVTNALLRAKGFDLDTLAKEHIDAYNETPKVVKPSGRVVVLGWGGSTTNSIERIINNEKTPYESGEMGGSGNGILMKMPTLAYWQSARETSQDERYKQYDLLTSMTHDSDVARITTRVHGDMLHGLLTGEFSRKSIGRAAYQSAIYHESIFGTTTDVTSALQLLNTLDSPAPQDVKNLYIDRANDATDRKFGFSYSFYAPETLLVAYSALVHGDGDFDKTVYTAVNLGGDADSTASIAGSMAVCASDGEIVFPSDIDKVQDIDKLRQLSIRLADIALSTS